MEFDSDQPPGEECSQSEPPLLQYEIRRVRGYLAAQGESPGLLERLHQLEHQRQDCRKRQPHGK